MYDGRIVGALSRDELLSCIWTCVGGRQVVNLENVRAGFCGLAVVGGMLGAAYHELDRQAVVASQHLHASPAQSESPAIATPPAPAPVYVSLDQLRQMCADEIRDGSIPPRDQSACALYERVEPKRERGPEFSAIEQSRRALAVMQDARAVQRQIDDASFGAPREVARNSPEQPAPACSRLRREQDNINLRMRRGYAAYEGERFRARLRSIERELCESSCVHC